MMINFLRSHLIPKARNISVDTPQFTCNTHNNQLYKIPVDFRSS